MPDEPSHEPPDASASADVCESRIDGKARIRCVLPRGHVGLHRWVSDDGARSFEWG